MIRSDSCVTKQSHGLHTSTAFCIGEWSAHNLWQEQSGEVITSGGVSGTEMEEMLTFSASSDSLIIQEINDNLRIPTDVVDFLVIKKEYGDINLSICILRHGKKKLNAYSQIV